jgi:hypothetical protein
MPTTLERRENLPLQRSRRREGGADSRMGDNIAEPGRHQVIPGRWAPFWSGSGVRPERSLLLHVHQFRDTDRAEPDRPTH